MRTRIPWVLLLVFGCGGLVESGSQIKLQELHRDDECAKLIQTADEVHGFIADRPDLLAEADFLKADCLMSMGQEGDAIALFRYVAERHPESPYAYRSDARVDDYEHRRSAAHSAVSDERVRAE